MKTRAFVLCVAISVPVAPSAADEPLGAGISSDAQVAERALEALHPGLYRYNTAEQMAQHFRELNVEMAAANTLPDAYIALARFLATIRCGHTYVNYENQSQSVQKALFQHPRLPFTFRWIDGRMVIVRPPPNGHELAPGMTVGSINGVPVSLIRDRLLSVARADGHNDRKRLADIEATGTRRYETFDIFWPLMFPSPGNEAVIGILEGNGERRVSVKLTPFLDRLAELHKVPSGPQQWELLVDGPIARIVMPSWVAYDSKMDWKSWLDHAFTVVRDSHVSELVIDLRGNEGGDDVGSELLTHLVSTATVVPSYERRVRYRKVADELLPYLSTWDPQFKDWGRQASPRNDGFFMLYRDADDAAMRTVEPREPSFPGRVWVLVNAANSSATFEFARDVRVTHRGILVGQQTGGNLRGINGGAFFFLKLPVSQLEIDVPLIGLFPTAPQPDGGLEPDIAVTPTVAAVAGNRDGELSVVRQLIADTPQ